MEPKKKILEKFRPEQRKDFEKLLKVSFHTDIPPICLALINKKRRHGYDIIKEIEQMYEPFGVNPPKASMIYPVLHTLEERGLVTTHWEERKKMYSITPKGKKELEIYKEVSKEIMKGSIKLLNELFGEKVV